jgi:predicted RNA polymerase sigma factor
MTSQNQQSQDDLLREARAVYIRAKKALTAGHRAVVGGVRLDHRTGYVRSVKHNLLPGVSVAEIKAEFEGGGHELKSKMRAPWSSSALAVNCFAHWRKDQSRLQLVELMPDDPVVRFGLAGAYLEAGQAESAIFEYCEETIRLKPDYTAAHRGLGRALERAGRCDKAQAAYQGLEVAARTGDLQTKKEIEVFLHRLDTAGS